MTHSSALQPIDTIEYASAFFGSRQENPAQAMKKSAEKHQFAMARRLEQLRTALGENEASNGQAAVCTSAPTKIRPRFWPAAMVVAGMVFAVAGSQVWQTNQPLPESPASARVEPTVPLTPQPVAITEQQEPAEQQRVEALLDDWRSAWMQRDTEAYLNAYSKDFIPADGSSRDSWVAARKKKLAAGAPIDLQFHQLAIDRIDELHFKATFLQDYASGSYREIARPKTLLIAREDSDWKITAERQEK